MKEKNFHSIDCFKLLMAICVIAIHTHPLESCSINIINKFYESFVAIAVPFFFLASGFLLAQKFDSSFCNQNNLVIIKNYLQKITKMYLTWTIIYIPLAIYHYITTETSILKSIILYIRNFIFVGEQYNSWHLWYLLATIYALIFILILKHFKLSPKKILLASFISFLLSIGIDYIITYSENTNNIINSLAKIIKLTIGSGRIFSGIFYITIGIMLSKKQPKLTISWLILIIGLFLNIIINKSYLDSIFIALSSIGLFNIINSFKLPNSKIYPILRTTSTKIYLTHMYIWTIYYMIVYKEKTFGLDSFLVTTAISIILANISIIIKNKKQKKLYNKHNHI